MSCNIYQSVKEVGYSKKEIGKVIQEVINKLGKKEVNLSVHFIGKTRIKKINKLYRGINEPTDVISFAVREGVVFPQTQNDAGDIFLCIPYIKSQAKRLGVNYKEELLRILIHGILHLFGFEHTSETGAKKMFELQEKLLGQVYENKKTNRQL